jgi:hypothetical protein
MKKLTHACLLEKVDLSGEEDFHFVSAILEIIERTAKDEMKQTEIWDLLAFVLRQTIELKTREQRKLMVNVFVLKLLTFLGYQIKLDAKLKNREINRSLDALSAEMVSALQDQKTISPLSLNRASNDKLFDFLLEYLRFVADCDFKALKSFS